MQFLIDYQLSNYNTTFALFIYSWMAYFKQEIEFLFNTDRNNNHVIPHFFYSVTVFKAWNVPSKSISLSYLELLLQWYTNKNIPASFHAIVSLPLTYATHVRLKLRFDRIFHSSLSFAESRNVRSFQSKFLFIRESKISRSCRKDTRTGSQRYVRGISQFAGTYNSVQQIRFLRVSGPRSLRLILSGAFFSNIPLSRQFCHQLHDYLIQAKLLKANPLWISWR